MSIYNIIYKNIYNKENIEVLFSLIYTCVLKAEHELYFFYGMFPGYITLTDPNTKLYQRWLSTTNSANVTNGKKIFTLTPLKREWDIEKEIKDKISNYNWANFQSWIKLFIWPILVSFSLK